MHYQEFNAQSAKTIILLHGLGANSDSWEYQFQPLADAGYRVIAPDMFGFGKSLYIAKKNTINSMADDVFALMQNLGVNKASFVGLSMGGAIAQSFALKYPQMVEKLVLANTSAKFAGKVTGSIYTILKRIFVMGCMPRKYGASMVSNFVFPKKGQEDFRAEFFKEIMVSNKTAYFDCVRSIIKFDVRAQLVAIAAPTLIIGSGADLVTPSFHQKQLHEAINGSKLVILPLAGHVSSVDSAAEFNKEILDFLGK